MLTTSTPLFTESQRFTQPWLWLLIGAAVVGGLGATIVAIQIEGPSPALITGFVCAFAIAVLLVLLFRFLELRVIVVPGTLDICFWPFHRRTISVESIRSFQARTYRPLAEYGGWGIRYGWKSGMAYNVKGNRGVQLELENGRRILIGSQKAEELCAALERARRQTTKRVPGRAPTSR